MDELDAALELKTREKIYDLIKKSPGLHFREIQRRTGLAIGSLQYHLEYLQKKHLVRQLKEGKFVRYYAVRESHQEDERQALALLRKEGPRKIVLYLLEKKRANNLRLARALKLSPSTISFHLQGLLEYDIVEKKQKGRKTVFTLKDPEKLAALLVKYQKTFLDELVDNFVDLWEKV